MTILEELQQAINQAINNFLLQKKGYKYLSTKHKKQVDTLLSLIDMKLNPLINSDAQLLREALDRTYEQSLRPSFFVELFDGNGLHAKVLAILEDPAFDERIIDARSRAEIKGMDWYAKLQTLTIDLQKKTEETGLYVARVQTLQTHCDHFQEKYQKLIYENKALEQKIKGLETKLATLLDENVLLQKLKELEEKVNTQTEIITNLLEENKLLNGEKTHMERRLVLIETERDAYKAKYEDLFEKYQNLVEEKNTKNTLCKTYKDKKAEKWKEKATKHAQTSLHKSDAKRPSNAHQFFNGVDQTLTTPKAIPISNRKEANSDDAIALSSFNNL